MRIAFLNQDRGISPNREKGAAVHLRALRLALARCGADVVPFDQPDEVRLAGELAAAHAERSFDLVYERYALGKQAGLAFARANDVPFALEVNAPLLEEAETWRAHRSSERDRECEEALFRGAQRVFAVSTVVADYVRTRGATQVEIVPNGVDTRTFRPELAPPAGVVPEDRLVIGFHGRLRPWHGIELLAEAVRCALDRELPLHMLTVGRGEWRAALATVPEDRHTHVEWLPHDQVARWVALFDVLPLTYPGPVYFSPLKLAEGMAVGAVPVVPHGGDWERFLVDGENALYYPTGSAAGLARALERLVFFPPERRSLSARAVETARGLSWDSIAERVLAVARHPSAGRGGHR